MERRKFLIGAGSAAVGSSALIGSGAFTQAEAQRDIELDIVPDDQNAYLGFAATSEYAEVSGGTLSLSFTDNSEGGSGLTSRGNTRFDDVFEIQNNGTNPVNVWVPSFTGAPTEDPGAASANFFVNEGRANENGSGYRYGDQSAGEVDVVDISWPTDIDPQDKPSNPIPEIGEDDGTGTGRVKTNYQGLRIGGGSAWLDVGKSVSVGLRFTVSNAREEVDSYDSPFFVRASVDQPTSQDDWQI